MKIPANFAFSQNNLQDFADCPRRFELRYLQKLAWPAVRSEPYVEAERHMLLGERFHRMVEQHQSGLSVEQIEALANEPELIEWWQAYQNQFPDNLPPQRYVEQTLAAPFGGYRIVAKYDLIAIQPGERAVIVDWKTNLRKPHRTSLRNRLQTRLYPFLLVEAGHTLNGRIPFLPEQIEMVYWFTADPGNPEIFPYSAQQYDLDRSFLQGMIAEIEAASQSRFALTTDQRMCRFCNYRSLCDRGEQAASMEEDLEQDDNEAQSGFDLDFDQITEIAY